MAENPENSPFKKPIVVDIPPFGFIVERNNERVKKITEVSNKAIELDEYAQKLKNEPFSGRKWEIVKNSSWGEIHKQNFGERSGYVICYKKGSCLIALCSVIGQPFVEETEIKANATLIAAAPDLLEACLAVLKGGKGCAPSVEFMDSLKTQCETAVKKALLGL